MTVSVQIPFSASVASGATNVFPYGFKVAHADDLSVQIDGELQVGGYEVTGVGDDAGGDVVFDVNPAAGAKVLRYLNPRLKRETDYQQFGDWWAPTVNLDFDRLWLAMQMLAQNASRSIKLPVDTADNQEITQDAATRANKGIKFDGDGNLTLSTFDPDTAQGAEAAASDSAAAALASEQAAAASAEAAAESAASIALPLPIASGGTGVTTAAAARAALGLVIGTDVQAVFQQLTKSEAQAGTETALRSVSPADLVNVARKLVSRVDVSGLGSYTFTGIPSWVTEVSISFENIITSAAAQILTQIGNAFGLRTDSYASYSGILSTALTNTRSDGFHFYSGGASNIYNGSIILSRMAESGVGITYVSHGVVSVTTGAAHNIFIGGGSAPLPGSTPNDSLTQIKISPASGTFSSGWLSIQMR